MEIKKSCDNCLFKKNCTKGESIIYCSDWEDEISEAERDMQRYSNYNNEQYDFDNFF